MPTMRRLGYLVVFLLGSTALTQTKNQTIWEPPDGQFPKNVKATVPKEMLSTLRVANYPIKLERTTMIDVAKHFGATIDSKGDAAEYYQWLCFLGGNPSDRWVLWLESGEIDGGNVSSFEWHRIPAAAVIDNRCVPLQEAPQLPLPLHLGMASAQVLKVLGPPSWRSQERLIYMHGHQVTIRGDVNDSSNIVDIDLHAGIVQAISVSKMTSS